MISLRPVLLVGFLALGALCTTWVKAQTPPQNSVAMQAKLENKAVVRAFMEALYMKNDPDAADALVSPNFIEHSPLQDSVPESSTPASIPAPKPDPKPPTLVVYTLEQVVADGEWVTTLLRVNEPGYAPYYFVDLFRVQRGLIVEHWDSSEPTLLPSSQGLSFKGKPSMFKKPNTPPGK